MKKLGIISLATLLTLSVTGCGKISNEDGAEWAKENGYIKYESSDTFTSSSITSESDYKVVSANADKLMAAMSKYKGTYLHATINQDGSVDVGYFIYSLKKADDGSYYITQSFGANNDGSVNQTVKNLERTGKGTAYFISHSYGEIVGTPRNVYKAVTGESAPTWAIKTYYSKSGETYTLTTSEPSNWSTNYTDYYLLDYIAYDDVYKVDWKAEDTPVTGAKMYYTVDKLDYSKDDNGKITAVKATLKVYKIDPIV